MDAIRLNTVELPSGDAEESSTGKVSQPGSFSQELGKAIDDVDRMQLAADDQANKIAAGNGNLHETALALEKADVSMRLLTRVRNKLVDTYQEIMRMSV